MLQATTESKKTSTANGRIDEVQALIEKACNEDRQDADEKLMSLGRDSVLDLPPELRLRWFYLVQVAHTELKRVVADLEELLESDNEVKIISLIGMTGIGKTTLASRLLSHLMERFSGEAKPHEVPVIVVSAPANGDRSMSWTVLYKNILNQGHEVLIPFKRSVETTATGEMHIKARTRATLAELREFIDIMLRNRNVRVLVIDEALHLLRFDDYGAIMDTLKSLADSYHTKLVLIGNFDIADLVSDYGQVLRRGEIIHYQRYAVGVTPGEKPSSDQIEFRRVVQKFQKLWPCKKVPNLMAIWYPLMQASLGSIGLLKITLLRLAALQMRAKGELTAAMFKKATKNRKALEKIETETVKGEQKLINACYGDSILSDAELAAVMREPEGASNG